MATPRQALAASVRTPFSADANELGFADQHPTRQQPGAGGSKKRPRRRGQARPEAPSRDMGVTSLAQVSTSLYSPRRGDNDEGAARRQRDSDFYDSLYSFGQGDLQRFDVPGLGASLASARSALPPSPRSERGAGGMVGGIRVPRPPAVGRGRLRANVSQRHRALSQQPAQPVSPPQHPPPQRPETEAGGAEQAAEQEMSDLANIRTGEDVISFFALHGSNSPVKFVHLNRAKTGSRFRPYDLVVVPPSEADPEYFTMSAAGVVRIAPNEPSDFIHLHEWMRQSTLFNVITSIRFFKHYLVAKMFRSWRSAIRYNLYVTQRKKLAHRLFLAKPSFCGPLLQAGAVNRCVSEMLNVTLLDLRNGQKTYEAGHFVDHQSQKRAEASKQFELIMEKVQVVVEKVCTDATNRARLTDDAINANGQLGGRDEKKTKSMVALKQEQAERNRMLKRATHEADMLGDFIRLVDYIAVEHLVQAAVNTHRTFLAELQRPTRKAGLFETTVRFGPGSMEFTPTDSDIQSMVREMSNGIIGTVNSVPRIVYIRPFKNIVANLVTEGPDVHNLVLGSDEFQKIRLEVDHKVGADFAASREYTKSFETVRPIYEYKDFDFQAYSRQEHSVGSIKREMLRLSGWVKDLEKMRVGYTVGILYVESRKLRSSLVPITEMGLNRMKSLLESLAQQRCKQALDEYKLRIRDLEAQPHHLKEFAAHVNVLRQVKQDTKAIMKNTAVVEEMYRLCSSYGMRISTGDIVQLDDLKSFSEEFASKLREAEGYVESQMSEMTQNLDMNIARLGDQLLQVRQMLGAGVFVDPEMASEPSKVLEEFETVRAKLSHMEELSKTYSQYQELFNITVYDYKNMRDVNDLFELNHDLWTNILLWNEKEQEWRSSEFAKVDVEEVEKDVDQMVTAAFKADKKIANHVTAQFRSKIGGFKARMPVVIELGNKSMKTRHWEKIFTGLGKRAALAKSKPGFTLQQLEDYGVFERAEMVSDVSGTASGEAQLSASLEKIEQGWSSTDFVLLPYRGLEDVYILGGLDEVFTVLEDNQVTLQTMMGSRFIMGVKAEVERWEKKLRLLSDTLDEWVTCQRNWMYLETIFSADDIQKQLPTEAQKFATVDKSWKDALRKTHQSPRVLAAVEGDHRFLELFREANGLLEEIQKSLEDYLETKRGAFPRFYFLSNDELLEILSQTKDPRAVQPHLAKCFDAMKSVKFAEDDEELAAAKEALAAAGQEQELADAASRV